ncbi:MAG: hypothetical protein E2576_14280 [Alcaligenaceae bacterium]|nr:hypothetical protein [Alcaligenaceae bacterium SAGV5]MPS50453.1 hypothetical protein [Alcaligenaceae bacterium SAGV3]MPT57886.1 hypothetical protein [Alcaligenaceae bacterium]
MPFVRAKRPVAAAPISFSVYDEFGQVQKVEFVAQYHRHDHGRVADLQDAMANHARKATGQPPIVRGDGTAIPGWEYATDLAFIAAKLAGWREMVGADGQPVAFSAEEVDKLVQDYPEAIVPLFNGFFEAHQQAREKN